jgi:hypothetical protein
MLIVIAQLSTNTQQQARDCTKNMKTFWIRSICSCNQSITTTHSTFARSVVCACELVWCMGHFTKIKPPNPRLKKEPAL